MAINPFIKKSRLIFFIVAGFFTVIILILNFSTHMLKDPPLISESNPLPERGQIVDRNGAILAMQTTLYNLSLNKNMSDSLARCAQCLAPALSISEAELHKKITEAPSHFVYLKKKITEGEKNLVKDIIEKERLSGLRIESTFNRTYPEPNLASTVVGFLGDDGFGLSGIEYSLQNILSPASVKGAQGGYRVVLTIDSNIQYMMEKLARATKASTQASSVFFLAMQAKTGEILAYVNEPSANLSQFPQSSDAERFDRPAYFLYEPGSVFKIFSLASFLDLGLTYDNESIVCDGIFSFDDRLRTASRPIRCIRAHGDVTPRRIIEFSCNDGIAQLADRISNAAFEQKLRLFGFGEKVGIELPAETPGLFASADRWSYRSRHTIAMGQEIGVSTLQIMQAATVFANEGYLIKPTLVSKILSFDGEKTLYTHIPQKKRQVISAQTAAYVLDYMRTSAQNTIGQQEDNSDLRLAIKTGTAEMAKADGVGYSSTDFLASCIGIFPADNPEIILYLAIEKPVGENYGSRIAAPVIAQAANEISDYYAMLRENAPTLIHSGKIPSSQVEPVVLGDTMPNVIGMPKRLLKTVMDDKRFSISIRGEGYVIEQNPSAGTALQEGMHIELIFE